MPDCVAIFFEKHPDARSAGGEPKDQIGLTVLFLDESWEI
jgi:hypothetical protein